MKFKIFIIISLVGLAIMVWYYSRPRREVVFCDVGQGDGAIVINANWQMVIDVGPDNGKMEECLGRHLPFWDKELEVVLISHWDKDHKGGLRGVQQLYRINNLYGGSEPKELFEQLSYSGNLASGEMIRAGEILFEVKLPEANWGQKNESNNEQSVVGLLQYGTTTIMFTGDMSGEEEQRLVWRGRLKQETGNEKRETRIIKVSHHGSKESTTEELIDAFKPMMAIISVGAKNKFGHPTKEVLGRLEKVGVVIRRTDKEGDVVIRI